jgi:branched-subunit amino acid ABC-type transport system permease component
MTWVAAAVAGVVAGASIGLLASALGLSSNRGRRLDLFPALAGAAVAVIAARAGGVTQFERMLNGIVAVPLVAVAGGVVALVVSDRPRSASEATREVLLPVSIAFAGQAALWQWAGGRAFIAPERTAGLEASGVLVVTWAEAASVAFALLGTTLLFAAARRGRTGRWWRTAEESPEMLALSGVEPVRLAARVAGLTAAAGGLAGLLLASTGPVPAPGVGDLGLRAGEALLVGGVRRPIRIVAAAVVLEVARALGDRYRAGWGPAIAAVLALVGGLVRLAAISRSRRFAGPDPVEELLR